MNTRGYLEQTMIADGWSRERFAEFWAWHKANPWVWQEFEKRSLRLLQAGKRKFGSKMIVENIRYDATLERKGAGEFKIQNSFTCAYARMFAIKYPKHSSVFTLKPLGQRGAEEVQCA